MSADDDEMSTDDDERDVIATHDARVATTPRVPMKTNRLPYYAVVPPTDYRAKAGCPIDFCDERHRRIGVLSVEETERLGRHLLAVATATRSGKRAAAYAQRRRSA